MGGFNLPPDLERKLRDLERSIAELQRATSSGAGRPAIVLSQPPTAGLTGTHVSRADRQVWHLGGSGFVNAAGRAGLDLLVNDQVVASARLFFNEPLVHHALNAARGTTDHPRGTPLRVEVRAVGLTHDVEDRVVVDCFE